MKKVFFTIALGALALSSCNKDQRAVRKLDGSWKVTSYEYTSGSETEIQNATDDYKLVFDFDNCKLKKDEYCNLIITSTSTGTTGVSTETEALTYKVEDDGSKLVIKSGGGTTSYLQTLTIEELSKDKLVLVDSEGATKEKYNFEKED